MVLLLHCRCPECGLLQLETAFKKLERRHGVKWRRFHVYSPFARQNFLFQATQKFPFAYVTSWHALSNNVRSCLVVCSFHVLANSTASTTCAALILAVRLS
jgi:hypothetical protein